MSAYPASDATPSWMRAPPESLRPTTGAPIFMARSMIFTIFAALVSESDPPKTVKSCANAYARRPLMRPWPAMTPSPGTTCSAMPKSRQRCVTNLSISSNVPESNRRLMRSRAVSFPDSRWRRSRSSPPPSAARRSRSAKTSSIKRRPSHFGALGLLPILQELLEADVGQGMFEQLIDDRCRDGHHVRAHARGLDHVNRAAHTRDEHFRRVVGIVEQVDNLPNDRHARIANVVETADERAHVARAGLGGQPCLGRGEDQRDID